MTALTSLFQRAWKPAVLWAFLVTALRLAGFLIVAAYALKRLPPDDMGFWFLVLNLVGLTSLCEMGIRTRTTLKFSEAYFFAERDSGARV